MSERENQDGSRNSTSAVSETKAPHSSDYAPYPRLNPNNITPPLHAPISGAAATTMLPEFKPYVPPSPAPNKLDSKRMWSGDRYWTDRVIHNGGVTHTRSGAMP
ncbi:hypothetical protein DY000_02050472 [Brassica cretica]|uniref:Uncharacterized protein n=1 Tax=Brassica cretica TaxID=69181 RepID=A0ABQ7ESS0_BRACR|nr:hypothetical protein DY000_02050472 [Brassica cretica]